MATWKHPSTRIVHAFTNWQASCKEKDTQVGEDWHAVRRTTRETWGRRWREERNDELGRKGVRSQVCLFHHVSIRGRRKHVEIEVSVADTHVSSHLPALSIHNWIKSKIRVHRTRGNSQRPDLPVHSVHFSLSLSFFSHSPALSFSPSVQLMVHGRDCIRPLEMQ